jgi:hypothetical protein
MTFKAPDKLPYDAWFDENPLKDSKYIDTPTYASSNMDLKMLIDLDKKELEIIVRQLWKSRKSEADVKEVYDKMEVYLNICNCQQQQ